MPGLLYGITVVISTGSHELVIGADRKVQFWKPTRYGLLSRWWPRWRKRVAEPASPDTTVTKLFRIGDRLAVASYGLMHSDLQPEFFYSFPVWLQRVTANFNAHSPGELAAYLHRMVDCQLLPVMDIGTRRGYFRAVKGPGDTLLGIAIVGLDPIHKHPEVYQVRLDIRDDGQGVELPELMQEFSGPQSVHLTLGMQSAIGQLSSDMGKLEQMNTLQARLRGPLHAQLRNVSPMTLDLALLTASMLELQAQAIPGMVGCGSDLLVIEPTRTVVVNLDALM